MRNLLTLLTLILLTSFINTSKANVCLLADGAPGYMEELCHLQTSKQGCKIMEAQGNCVWHSTSTRGICRLADGAPNHIRTLCELQQRQGCEMMEDQGNCTWHEL